MRIKWNNSLGVMQTSDLSELGNTKIDNLLSDLGVRSNLWYFSGVTGGNLKAYTILNLKVLQSHFGRWFEDRTKCQNMTITKWPHYTDRTKWQHYFGFRNWKPKTQFCFHSLLIPSHTTWPFVLLRALWQNSTGRHWHGPLPILAWNKNRYQGGSGNE